MKEALISVIVPVYNCENFVEECLESIVNQTYKNIEIITIDDGSTDSSLKLCQKFQSKYPDKITVIHQENQGQASARNVGIAKSKGEYIGFVDADDWIEPNMYEILLRNLIEDKCDISCCGIRREYINGNSTLFWHNTRDYFVFTPENAIKELIKNTIITCSVWDKLYKRGIITSNPMPNGIIYEDLYIMPHWISAATQIVYEGLPLYHYRENKNGTLHNRTIKIFDVLYSIEERSNYIQSNYPSLTTTIQEKRIEMFIDFLVATYRCSDFSEKRETIRKKILDDTTISKKYNFNKKYRFKLFLLSISLKVFDFSVLVYSIIKKR